MKKFTALKITTLALAAVSLIACSTATTQTTSVTPVTVVQADQVETVYGANTVDDNYVVWNGPADEAVAEHQAPSQALPLASVRDGKLTVQGHLALRK